MLHNNQNIESSNDILFFKIFRNNFIKRLIFNHLNLYFKNKDKTFCCKKELIDYKEREYIIKLRLKQDYKKEKHDHKFNELNLYRGDIPFGITNLEIRFDIINHLKIGFIPSSVTILQFADKFHSTNKYQLKIGDIPSSVKELTLGGNFNQVLFRGLIPSFVTKLSFGYKFNQKFKNGDIPSSVTILDLSGSQFNQRIYKDDIPSSITTLKLSAIFNDLFESCIIPQSITTISFGFDLCQRLLNNKIIIKQPNIKQIFTFGVDMTQSFKINKLLL